MKSIICRESFLQIQAYMINSYKYLFYSSYKIGSKSMKFQFIIEKKDSNEYCFDSYK